MNPRQVRVLVWSFSNLVWRCTPPNFGGFGGYMCSAALLAERAISSYYYYCTWDNQNNFSLVIVHFSMHIQPLWWPFMSSCIVYFMVCICNFSKLWNTYLLLCNTLLNQISILQCKCWSSSSTCVNEEILSLMIQPEHDQESCKKRKKKIILLQIVKSVAYNHRSNYVLC